MTLKHLITAASILALLPALGTAGLEPLKDEEMTRVSGQALGINFDDVSIISDPGTPADMTYATLRPSAGDDYVRMSHFYAVGAGGNRTTPTDGDGIDLGSVDSPITLQFPQISNALVNDGSLADRSAMVLCWTGSDCSDPTNIDHSLPDATTKADLGFRFDIITDDTNLTYRDDSDNGMTQIVWVELNNFGLEGESVPSKALRQIINPKGAGLGNENADGNTQACDDGDGDNVCADGLGTTLYDNDIIHVDGQPLEATSEYGGSWVAIWPDELTGLSMAANIRLDADQLRWTYESNAGGTASDFSDPYSIAMNNVSVDLQLGHPFYQPVRLYTSSSYNSDTDRTVAEQVLEISSIPLLDSSGRQPGDSGYSGVDCSTGTACDRFYDPSTNTTDIHIGELRFGDLGNNIVTGSVDNGDNTHTNTYANNLGASYVQGVQIQYLRVQTHDIVN